jgi:hypothetical protein
MGFEVRDSFFGRERWADANAGSGRILFPAHPGPGGVDAVGRDELSRRDLNVRGRDVDRMPAPVAVDDRTGDEEIASQVGGGGGYVPGGDGGPDARGGEDAGLIFQRRNGLDGVAGGAGGCSGTCWLNNRLRHPFQANEEAPST